METLEETTALIKEESTQINPSKIMEVGMASKSLLTAVNMNLFTLLANRARSAK